jgi:hypothetical protein
MDLWLYQLYVDDTYNHKIKRIDPETRVVETFLGRERGGHASDPDGAVGVRARGRRRRPDPPQVILPTG